MERQGEKKRKKDKQIYYNWSSAFVDGWWKRWTKSWISDNTLLGKPDTLPSPPLPLPLLLLTLDMNSIKDDDDTIDGGDDDDDGQ